MAAQRNAPNIISPKQPLGLSPHIESMEATENFNVSFSPISGQKPRTGPSSANKTARGISPFSKTILKQTAEELPSDSDKSDSEKVESLTVNKFKKILESCCGAQRREKRSVSTVKKNTKNEICTERRNSIKTTETKKNKNGNKSIRHNRSALRFSIRHDNI